MRKIFTFLCFIVFVQHLAFGQESETPHSFVNIKAVANASISVDYLGVKEGVLNVSSNFQTPGFILELIEEEFHKYDITEDLTVSIEAGTSLVKIDGEYFVPADVLVSIFAADGRVRFSPVSKGNELSINFSAEPDGVYYLILENLKKKRIAKFKITKNVEVSAQTKD